ncbi:hypothetical protein F5Y04DRAFT_283752 [Hypomontagnella monticulosa]|nr:hypothetical protein F5Y04DRAFT_283752 [Hypomontagnella monticulosa]
MLRERLHDTAIELHHILSQKNLRFGIFGGYAIAVMQGVRDTSDIDCLVSASKDDVIEVLDGKGSFILLPSPRQDYALFHWRDLPTGRYPVQVKMFFTHFPEAIHTMEHLPSILLPITGRFGPGVSYFLDPFTLFKGKLRAAVGRERFYDSADLRALAWRYEPIIKARARELDPKTVGVLLKRYEEMTYLFDRLGVNIREAQRAAYGFYPDNYVVTPVGDVQYGLLA